jgi:hypothetical protein
MREAGAMERRSTKVVKKAEGRTDRLYTLDVFLISGPITKRFAKKNPTVSRTIETRGNQTLADLHDAIFRAFDREEEHMYEFQLGGKGPDDPKAKRYVLPMAMDGGPFAEEDPAGDVTRTTICSLNLKTGQAFGYWFDFGDDWWHQINVVSITDGVPRGKYPRVTKRVGKSPLQYPGWDTEED